jgi:serine/threonine protein phosphatase PrpC
VEEKLPSFLRELFRRKERSRSIDAADNIETIPLMTQRKDNYSIPVENYNPSQIIFASAQSVGKQRDHNEDTLFAMSTCISGEEIQYNLGIFIVADGMGGHQYGEIASAAAVKKFVEVVVKKSILPGVLGAKKLTAQTVQGVIGIALEEAHKVVQLEAPGGGTTFTGAVILNQEIILAHAGDSRAYMYLPDDSLEVLTKDHSLVGRLVELGQITEKEASTHPQRNILLRAIGQPEPFKPDITTKEFQNESILIICSDGLWGVVSKSEIKNVMKNGGDTLQDDCQKLVDLANAKGGPDNISVIMAKCLL